MYRQESKRSISAGDEVTPPLTSLAAAVLLGKHETAGVGSSADRDAVGRCEIERVQQRRADGDLGLEISLDDGRNSDIRLPKRVPRGPGLGDAGEPAALAGSEARDGEGTRECGAYPEACGLDQGGNCPTGT